MYRNSLIACVLTLACFIILTPSLGVAKTDRQNINGSLEG